MTGPDLAAVRAVCLRFPEAEEAELQGRPLFRVRGWMAVRLDTGALDPREMAELVEAAYRHVAGRRLVGVLDRGR